MKSKTPSPLRILEEAFLDYRIRSHFYYESYVNSLGLTDTEHLLEFGCGGGAMSRVLARILKTRWSSHLHRHIRILDKEGTKTAGKMCHDRIPCRRHHKDSA